MRTFWLDTNVVLRFLLGEPKELAQRAYRILKAAEEGRVRLVWHPLVVAEVVYTLRSFYKVPLPQVVDRLEALWARPGMWVLEEEAFRKAFGLMLEKKVHLTDAMLAVKAALGEGVASLDQDFLRLGVEVWDGTEDPS